MKNKKWFYLTGGLVLLVLWYMGFGKDLIFAGSEIPIEYSAYASYVKVEGNIPGLLVTTAIGEETERGFPVLGKPIVNTNGTGSTALRRLEMGQTAYVYQARSTTIGDIRIFYDVCESVELDLLDKLSSPEKRRDSDYCKVTREYVGYTR